MDPSGQPRLFAELESVAAALREPMPQEVYIIAGVNAWVRERGGWMSIGSRRVMGLGLPLMQILSIAQFRAVLAHEFGHYYSGDTRLGPWVYKTRTAMLRTINAIGNQSELIGLLARVWVGITVSYLAITWLLEGYGILYLRCTQWVSRRQEYRADELACHVANPRALIDGLRAIHGAALELGNYWETDVNPILSAGFHPPLAEGFGRFIADPQIANSISQGVASELREPKPKPYDSHPPLRDRIAAAERIASAADPDCGPLAISLLDDVPSLERSLLQCLNPKGDVKQLKSTQWDSVGQDVLIPWWRAFTQEYDSLLQGLTVETLPEVAPKLHEMGSKMRDPKGMLYDANQRAQHAVYLLWVALALALVERGWQVDANPGHLILRHASLELDPAQTMVDVISGKLGHEAWAQRCQGAGIQGLRLANAQSLNTGTVREP